MITTKSKSFSNRGVSVLNLALHLHLNRLLRMNIIHAANELKPVGRKVCLAVGMCDGSIWATSRSFADNRRRPPA